MAIDVELPDDDYNEAGIDALIDDVIDENQISDVVSDVYDDYNEAGIDALIDDVIYENQTSDGIDVVADEGSDNSENPEDENPAPLTPEDDFFDGEPRFRVPSEGNNECFGHGGDNMPTYDSYASNPESHFSDVDGNYMYEPAEETEKTNLKARRELEELTQIQEEEAELEEEARIEKEQLAEEERIAEEQKANLAKALEQMRANLGR